MKVAVIGAGSWGTALANVLAEKGNEVALWARRQELADSINANHKNPSYLKEAQLSDNIWATSSFEEALNGSSAAVVVTPSSYARQTCNNMAPYISADLPVAICSKGVEAGTGLLMTEVAAEVFGNPSRLAAISGPNHAEEVILGQPSATVVAGEDETTVLFFRDLFATELFRTYASDDPVGVELCAAFKNVIAIAVGISYGIGFGDNTSAMIITRGLAEMSRMVSACGGNAMTCMGLAGAGDMVVTCMSRHSRNRRFGQDYVAEGKTMADFEADTHMVVEGAVACKTMEVLSVAHGVELPITDAIRDIVWNNRDPQELARTLTSRPLTTEFYGI